MNKFLYIGIIPLLCSFFLLSCEKTEVETQPVTINTVWTVFERTIKTNDSFFDGNVNEMFRLDAKKYKILRKFDLNENVPNVGSFVLTAVDPESGVERRKRDGTYAIVGDSIFTQDGDINDMREAFKVTSTTLTTVGKVTKKELNIIVSELGGDPNAIPFDVEGVLTIRAIR